MTDEPTSLAHPAPEQVAFRPVRTVRAGHPARALSWKTTKAFVDAAKDQGAVAPPLPTEQAEKPVVVRSLQAERDALREALERIEQGTRDIPHGVALSPDKFTIRTVNETARAALAMRGEGS